jgi:RNA polymerase sigma-70 factor (ECF subfamily)
MPQHRHREPLSDEQLLKNIAQKCQDCFAILFTRYFRAVLAIASRILRDTAEAEDILQEVFLAIFLRQEQFDSTRGTVRTWILQFAYFKSMLRRRYLSIRNFYQQEELNLALESRIQVTFERTFGLTSHEVIRLLEAGLLLLPPLQRRAIELVHFEGRTMREISELTGESLATTRNNYYRGIKQLRTYLRGNEESREVVLPAESGHE